MEWHQVLELVASMAVTAAFATKAIRSKLSDVEAAIKDHVADDKATHASHEARIIKLEGRTRVRR